MLAMEERKYVRLHHEEFRLDTKDIWLWKWRTKECCLFQYSTIMFLFEYKISRAQCLDLPYTLSSYKTFTGHIFITLNLKAQKNMQQKVTFMAIPLKEFMLASHIYFSCKYFVNVLIYLLIKSNFYLKKKNCQKPYKNINNFHSNMNSPFH